MWVVILKKGICFLSFPLFALASTWTGTVSTDWSASTNWKPFEVPNSNAAQASFTQSSPGHQPSISSTIPINSIQFGTGVSTTISKSATGNLAFQGNSPSIVVDSSGNEITPPISLLSNLTVSLTSSQSSLTLSEVISGETRSLTVVGSGTLYLIGMNTYKDTTLNSGTIAVKNDSLGKGTVENNGGTLKILDQVETSQNFVLNNSAKFNTNGQNLTISGLISGDGSLNQIDPGSGKFTLKNVNTYKGGTAVTGGILMISQNENLGDEAGSLTLSGGILELEGGFSLASALGVQRKVSISGTPAISLSGSGTCTLGGVISGSGSLNITGGSGNVLHLAGVNTYSGSMSVSGATLEGTTSSVRGDLDITNGGTVTFNQSTDGIYSGSLSGSTAVLNFNGQGIYTLSGNSSSFSGSVTLTNSNLILTGNLGCSSFQLDGILSGSGTLTSRITLSGSGTLSPGIKGEKTLTVEGDVKNPGTFFAEVNPLSNGILDVKGNADFSSTDLVVNPGDSGFYGLYREYTLVTAENITQSFGKISITSPRFTPSVIPTSTSILLKLANLTPFFDFPFSNRNERAVGKNLDTISSQGLLSLDLTDVINSLTNHDQASVNQALDQMHPAALGGYSEVQMNLGGHLLSTLKKGSSPYRCKGSNQLWVEPFGNWLDVGTKGKNLGFHTTTKGVAFGYDRELFGFWTLGVGGAYQSTDLKWSKDRGNAYLKGGYGIFKSDFIFGKFVFQGAFYAGKDWYKTMRHIHFTSIDRQATSSFSGLDIGSHLGLAYYLGMQSFHLYPYLDLDYLYLNHSAFKETGADSLSLSVESYKSSTLRSQTGISMRFSDRNRDNTMCISPLLSLGYTFEAPLYRSSFKSRFAGQTISFQTYGWNECRHLLNVQFGLGVTYKCFALDSFYVGDISLEGSSVYSNQRGDFHFRFQF